MAIGDTGELAMKGVAFRYVGVSVQEDLSVRPSVRREGRGRAGAAKRGGGGRAKGGGTHSNALRETDYLFGSSNSFDLHKNLKHSTMKFSLEMRFRSLQGKLSIRGDKDSNM